MNFFLKSVDFREKKTHFCQKKSHFPKMFPYNLNIYAATVLMYRHAAMFPIFVVARVVSQPLTGGIDRDFDSTCSAIYV